MTSRRALPAVATPLIAAALFVATPRLAEACERTISCSETTNPPCGPDETPVPIAWPSTCVGFHVNERGSVDVADYDALRATIASAFEVWNAVPDAYLELIDLGDTNVHQAGYDPSREDAGNLNVVMFVEDRWPTTYPPAALALTRVTYSTTGVIYDADIEVNGRFPFAIYEVEPAPGEGAQAYDLPSTLVHEVGHFVGLDHTQPETFIGDPEEADSATMHASSGAGQLHKRTLHEDDIACFVQAYPLDAAGDAATCDPVPNADFHDAVQAEVARGFGEFGELCLDGVDNDNDGLVDCDEPDCDVVIGCTDAPEAAPTRGGSGGCAAGGPAVPTTPWLVLTFAALAIGGRRRSPRCD